MNSCKSAILLTVAIVTISSDCLAEDQIKQWCEIGGNHKRWANVEIAGYQPCGDLKIERSCDATGKRFFGKGSSPHSYLSCELGQRIQISSTVDPRAAQGDFAVSDNPGDAFVKSLTALNNKKAALDKLLARSGQGPLAASINNLKTISSGEESISTSELLIQLQDILKTVSARNNNLDSALQE